MMQYFKPAELPEWCYPFEVAYWRAFGRLPVLMWVELEDARRSKERILEIDEVVDFGLGFFEDEFRAMGIKLDFKRYEAVRSVYYETAQEYLSYRERIAGQLSKTIQVAEAGPLAEMLASFHQETSATRAELEWAEEMESEMAGVLEFARGEVLKELHLGNLVAEGWFLKVGGLSSKEEISEADIEFVAIPALDWTRKSFNWRESELPTRSGAYRHVMVSTEDMLRCFPSPHANSVDVTAKLFPGVAIFESGAAISGIRPKAARGRPPRGAGLDQRTIVKNYFESRIQRPDSVEKQEALIADIQAFGSRVFKENIPRSTIQSWIGPLPENAPKNGARK